MESRKRISLESRATRKLTYSPQSFVPDTTRFSIMNRNSTFVRADSLSGSGENP